jgi:uncharacterized protein (UPF0303 family)
VVWDSNYFTVTADKVTTIDNGSWVRITIYYVSEFSRESFNMKLEHMEEGGSSNNIIKIIMKAVSELTSMSRRDVAQRMLAFGAGKL